MDAISSAQPGVGTVGSQSAGRFRSATEHDVYADNRDEDIFGWIQPDEWDTVAGPNKSNFMRGECVECAPDQDKCAIVPSPLQSCGGPSCGYGAQCCEYSRRATHTSGPSQREPAVLLQRDTNSKVPPSSRIDELAKTEQKSSLGVSLIDIIHGRSCRPISLLDLRTFLYFQRQPQKRLPSYYPASDMQSSALDDFDLNLDLPSSSTASSPSSAAFIKATPPKGASQRLHHDEVDALDFLVAYERYLTKFRDQARAERLKSPDPATCKAAVRAYVRRACKPRPSTDLTANDVLLQGSANADDLIDIPEEVSREVLARLKPTDLGLRPESQPLRVEFDRLVHRYLCSRRVCILPSSRKGAKKRSSSSSSTDTAPGAPDSSLQHRHGSSKTDKVPRLHWMVDVGLISDDQLQLALAECDFSTHPDVLAPVAEAVYVYMSQHVVPFFFISVARNLSPNTKRGRLLIGVVCTTIALIFSILLIVTPSPLAPHAHHGTGEISRWWRLLTAPIWCAGLGYILAYFTGLCVWLTLRGNREPDEEEEREREEIRSRISTEDVGFDLAELQAAANQRDMEAEQETNPWMAPEIANILIGFAGLHKDKHSRQRSASDVHSRRNSRFLGDARPRARSEVVDAPVSVKVSMDESFADTSNAIGLQPSMEKDAAAPAAVILNTPRKNSAPVADPSAAALVRPSMDRAPSSSNDLRQADVKLSATAHSTSAPALMKQKRVPLLNFSIGIVTKSGTELAEEHVDTPVLTRDALLFDPELAARVALPASHGTATSGSSPHGSPPAFARRKSLAHALLPLKSGLRMQAQVDDVEKNLHARERSGESDAETEGVALPKVPEATASPLPALDPRDIAPWSAPVAVKPEPPSTTSKSLLFALPSNRRSRLSTTTSATAVSPLPIAVSTPSKRTYEKSHTTSLKQRVWTAIQRGTGFAVGTERVLDARVRRAQQMKALRIMALNTLATVVAVVIVVAIP